MRHVHRVQYNIACEGSTLTLGKVICPYEEVTFGRQNSRSESHTSGNNTVGHRIQRRLSRTVSKQVRGTVKINEFEDSLNTRVLILLHLQLLTFGGFYLVSTNNTFPFLKDHFVLLKDE